MTSKQWAALAVRVLAIYAVINSFGWIESCLNILSVALSNGGASTSPTPFWQYVLSFSPFIGFASCGVLIWISADALATFMTGEEDHNSLSSAPLQAVEILTLAFCIMGVWMTLHGLPFLVAALASLLLSPSPTLSLVITNRNEFAELLTQLSWSIIPIITGISLLLSARRFADKLVLRYRLAPVSED